MAFCTPPLHRAAERHPTLELLGDRFGHQRGIDLGLADLDDVEVQLGGVKRVSFLRSVSMSAPFLPMMTPGRAVWIVTRHLRCGRSMMTRLTPAALTSSWMNSRIRRSSKQQVAVILAVGIPAAVPGAVDLQAHADRIDLLTITLASRLAAP